MSIISGKQNRVHSWLLMNSYLEAESFHLQGFKSLDCMPHLDRSLREVS